jgi:hypothetical protein
MLKDSEIGNIAAIGPAGHPPGSKYERLIADAKQVQAPTTVVVHPCEETALRGPIEAAKAGIIVPILVGPAAKIAAVAREHRLDISRFEIVEWLAMINTFLPLISRRLNTIEACADGVHQQSSTSCLIIARHAPIGPHTPNPRLPRSFCHRTATHKPRRAFVDPAIAPDERGQWLRTRLVLRRIPHHARPLGSGPLVYFLAISGA